MAKILVVDDELDFLKMAAIRLKASGYEIDTAVNGEEALLKIRASKPQLVVLDVKLPLLNGFEVLRLIKSDPESAAIPVILASADASAQIEMKSK